MADRSVATLSGADAALCRQAMARIESAMRHPDMEIDMLFPEPVWLVALLNLYVRRAVNEIGPKQTVMGLCNAAAGLLERLDG